jgi:hypothetical protein
MSGETENREDILPHSLAFRSHLLETRLFGWNFLEWVSLSLFLLRKPKPDNATAATSLPALILRSLFI